MDPLTALALMFLLCILLGVGLGLMLALRWLP